MVGVCGIMIVNRTGKCIAVVGERGQYMAKGHVFITAPMSIIQSAILYYIMRE
jgi:hypothetical protein